MIPEWLIKSVSLVVQQQYGKEETMTAKKLVDSIRNEFFIRLERKTGWGKNEVKVEFTSAVIDAISKTIHLSEHPDLGEEDEPDRDDDWYNEWYRDSH